MQAPTHKVAIVYSDTTAALYFSQTAYADLFMAAQNQARMAGVSYDIIDESQLTNINNLIGYDAIIFPSMADVNTAELPAIMSTLISAVYNYHISIITAGDFLTNDQTGAPLPGNPYSNMETLLGLARVSGGNSGAITVTANDVTNPIMKSYTAGQVIQTYPSEGYAAYQAVGGTATDVLVNQTVTDPTLTGGTETIPGVIQTTTGGTNVEFASRICSATATCCRTPSRPWHSVHSQALHCTSRGTPASSPCAWTWTSRSSLPTFRRRSSCERESNGSDQSRHLRHADPDPAAVEPAIQFRRILFHQHRR